MKTEVEVAIDVEIEVEVEVEIEIKVDVPCHATPLIFPAQTQFSVSESRLRENIIFRSRKRIRCPGSSPI